MERIIHILLIGVVLLAVAGQGACWDSQQDSEGEAVVADKPQQQEISAASDGGQTKTGSKPDTQPAPLGGPHVVEGNTTFGLRLFDEVRKKEAGKNVFVSPLSISIAFAMTYNGASGETAKEMARILGFDGLGLDPLNQAMAALTEALELPDSTVEISIANSLWGRQGLRFAPDFLERNRISYRAAIKTLDFRSPETPGVINDWVTGATRGKIDRIIDQIPPEMVLYLINAIYFNGKWQNEFDPDLTKDQPFYLAGGGETNTPMMARSGEYRYFAEPDFQAVRLPYGNDRTSMYVFLPNEKDGLGRLLDGLDTEIWAKWMEKPRKRDGDVLLPRFKVEYESELKPILKAMGMTRAFTAGQADFSGMLAPSAELYISEVKHKAVVDVNEEGTEAAAVTSIGIGVTSVQPEKDRFRFVADHPFFFFIRDDGSGSILFAGVVYDPTS